MRMWKIVRNVCPITLNQRTSQNSFRCGSRARSFHVLKDPNRRSKRATTWSMFGLLAGSSCTMSSTMGFMKSRPVYTWDY